jgi:hypothetical protein
MAKKGLTKQEIGKVAVLLTDELRGGQFAIRGTASLLLQGIDMVALDIDVVADKKTALSCNKLLKDYLVEKVEYKETDKFKSYFGNFKIEGAKVEVCGQWQIRSKKGWSEVFDASADQIKEVEIRVKSIPVTTIETELMMFAKMGRWNAFHKIKREAEKKRQSVLL